jgi:predicted nuclease of predicted toxin-antitoxin system
VRFWIDAQLPPQLATWLRQSFHVEAANLDRRARDADISSALRAPGEVIITKDADFLDIVARLDAPPQIVWVTCGNVTNAALQALFARTFQEILNLLRAGAPVVELAKR